MKFEDLASTLDVIHVGVDGETYAVDSSHPANAYTSQRLDGKGHALLVDIDCPPHRAVDGWWLAGVPLSGLPTMTTTLPEMLDTLGIVVEGRIVADYLTVGSHTPRHQHLYVMADLDEQELALVHAALVCVGIEGWGNLLRVLRRGYSVLYFPGAKATRPGPNSGERHAT